MKKSLIIGIILVILFVIIIWYLLLTDFGGYWEKINELAVKNNDPSICNILPNDVWPSLYHPKESCYFFAAKKLKNSSICDIAPLYNDLTTVARCYLGIAFELKSISPCMELEEKQNQKRKTSELDYVDYVVYGYCYDSYIISSQDSKECSLIKNNDYRIDCENSVNYRDYPLESCYKINNAYLKAKCYSNFAMFNKNSSVCYSINDTDEYTISRCLSDAISLSSLSS